MLPPDHRQAHQEFSMALLQVQKTLDASIPDKQAIAQNGQELQQVFQRRIASLTADQLDPALVSRWQSFQTEIHKQMRLLEMDVMFLQASRQSATSSVRYASMRSRIKTLLGYCEALLQV